MEVENIFCYRFRFADGAVLDVEALSEERATEKAELSGYDCLLIRSIERIKRLTSLKLVILGLSYSRLYQN